MKKLQKLNLKDAAVLDSKTMKNITGGYYDPACGGDYICDGTGSCFNDAFGPGTCHWDNRIDGEWDCICIQNP